MDFENSTEANEVDQDMEEKSVSLQNENKSEETKKKTTTTSSTSKEKTKSSKTSSKKKNDESKKNNKEKDDNDNSKSNKKVTNQNLLRYRHLIFSPCCPLVPRKQNQPYPKITKIPSKDSINSSSGNPKRKKKWYPHIFPNHNILIYLPLSPNKQENFEVPPKFVEVKPITKDGIDVSDVNKDDNELWLFVAPKNVC